MLLRVVVFYLGAGIFVEACPIFFHEAGVSQHFVDVAAPFYEGF